MVDGGRDYIRRNVHKEHPFKELSLYSDDSHEELRNAIFRGGRGINGDQPLKYVLMKDINLDWLKAIIVYEEKLRPNNPYLPVFRNELEYRKK